MDYHSSLQPYTAVSGPVHRQQRPSTGNFHFVSLFFAICPNLKPLCLDPSEAVTTQPPPTAPVITYPSFFPYPFQPYATVFESIRGCHRPSTANGTCHHVSVFFPICSNLMPLCLNPSEAVTAHPPASRIPSFILSAPQWQLSLLSTHPQECPSPVRHVKYCMIYDN